MRLWCAWRVLQALVSTVEARELWPVLLSKAVYKLYHLSGARALHPDLLASNSEAAYHSDRVTPCLLQQFASTCTVVAGDTLIP